MKGIYKERLSIGEILKASWKIYKENFRVILTVILIVYIPLNFVLSIIPVDSLEDLSSFMRIMQILEGLIGIIATLAIIYVSKSVVDGKKVDYRDALKKALGKWGNVFSTNILVGLYVLGLTFLFIIPGIIYSVYWAFVASAVLLNGLTGKKALDYSKSIVQGRWWLTLGYFVGFSFLGGVASFVMSFPTWFLPTNIVLDTLSFTVTDIVSAYFIVVLALFYINFEATRLPQEG